MSTHELRLNAARAAALRAGIKTQHRLPVDELAALGIKAGDTLAFVEFVSKARNTPICSTSVSRIETARLEAITDDEIVAEGYANWSLMALDWSAHNRTKANHWEQNPEVAVLILEGVRP